MNIYDQIYNEKLGELIKDILYEGIVVGEFNELVEKAILRNTHESLSCSIPEYLKVFENATCFADWYLPEMFIAIRAMQSLTPHDMGVTPLLWVSKRDDILAMASAWNTIAAPYMDEARKFAEDKARRDKRELEAKNRLVNLNGRPAHAK